MADRFGIPQQAIVRSTRAGGVETLGRKGIFLCVMFVPGQCRTRASELMSVQGVETDQIGLGFFTGGRGGEGARQGDSVLRGKEKEDDNRTGNIELSTQVRVQTPLASSRHARELTNRPPTDQLPSSPPPHRNGARTSFCLPSPYHHPTQLI